jgi:GNAT superfamily N-acetyltransferase
MDKCVILDTGGQKIRVRYGTPEDALAAVDVLCNVATWLIDKGVPLWDPVQFSIPDYVQHAQHHELVVGFEGEELVACMLVYRVDYMFWPEAEPGSALYLHKIARKRSAVAQSWGRRMIDWAVEQAKQLAIPRLRLDCDPRPELIEFYQAMGFHPVDNGSVLREDGRVIRFEREV